MEDRLQARGRPQGEGRERPQGAREGEREERWRV